VPKHHYEDWYVGWVPEVSSGCQDCAELGAECFTCAYWADRAEGDAAEARWREAGDYDEIDEKQNELRGWVDAIDIDIDERGV
jgi:hypothetical protein